MDLQPGVGTSLENGWRRMWPNFGPLFLIWFVNILFALPAWIYSIISHFEPGFFALGMYFLFSTIYSILLLNPLKYGQTYSTLRAARGEQPQLPDLFHPFDNYWSAVSAQFIIGLLVSIGTIFLIVPGIIIACKLIFVPYLVVDRRMSCLDAISASWKLTDGYAWNVFGIILIGIPIHIVGLICLVVGVIPAYLWIQCAMASLYLAITSSEPPSEQTYGYPVVALQ